MNRLLLICSFLLCFQPAFTQSPLGLWENAEDGEVQSYIKIYEEEGKLHGKVMHLTPEAKVTHCNSCDGNEKGASLIGMDILEDLEPSGSDWDYGTILDPKKGKRHKCKISLADQNTLKVRGYIGSPIFGKTFKWMRCTKELEKQYTSAAGL